MFLILLSKRTVWIWLTTINWFCETFKISIYNKRNGEFFVMILKIKYGFIVSHFYSHCFLLSAICYVFFKEIFLYEKTFFTNEYFSCRI